MDHYYIKNILYLYTNIFSYIFMLYQVCVTIFTNVAFLQCSPTAPVKIDKFTCFDTWRSPNDFRNT